MVRCGHFGSFFERAGSASGAQLCCEEACVQTTTPFSRILLDRHCVVMFSYNRDSMT